MDRSGPKPFAFRLSTADLPDEDRVAVWVEEFSKTLFKIDVEPLPKAPFFQNATLRKLPGLSMTAGAGSAVHAVRTAAHISESVNDFMFHIHLGGSGRFIQGGREASFGSGEAILASGELVTDVVYPNNFKYLSLCIPRHALVDRLPDADAVLLRPVPKDGAVLRLLTGYLTAMEALEDSSSTLETTADLIPAFVTHVHDLIAMTLGATRDAEHQALGSGVRAARLHAIKSEITGNPGGLHSIVDAARRHGVTPRYVQKLFEADGKTFTEFVVNARLAYARRLLQERASNRQTIGAIAFEAGFADLSNFNRAFRRRYGLTPSEARAAVKHDDT